MEHPVCKYDTVPCHDCGNCTPSPVDMYCEEECEEECEERMEITQISEEQARDMLLHLGRSKLHCGLIIQKWKEKCYIKEEIMDCPFCGEEEQFVSCYIDDKRRELFYIECEDCGCRTPDFVSTIETIRAWNKRV